VDPALTQEREDFSAGGVVVRDQQVIVIVPVKRTGDGERVLALPKGHLDQDESPEQGRRARSGRRPASRPS